MSIREYPFGNVSDLPDADYLRSLDLSHLFRLRLEEDAVTYGNKVAPEVVDLPDIPHVLARHNRHYMLDDDLDELAQDAIAHFEAMRENGIGVPDLRFVITSEGHVRPSEEAIYTFVRRVGGVPLHETVSHRPDHVRTMLQGVGSYYRWTLTTPGVRRMLLDTYRTDNYTVSDPTDPKSGIVFHDVDPWFTGLYDERGKLEFDVVANAMGLHYLNRNLQNRAEAPRDILRLVEGRGRRLLHACFDAIVNRPDYENV